MKKIIIAFSLALVLIMVLLYFPDISSWFWGEVVREDGSRIIAPEKIITYVGAALGGTILLFQLMENNRRNDIADRGQVNLRFKDAAMLLGSEDTASILSGIYALHQIAIECSKGKKEQRGFVKVIHDILCAYVRESAKTITNDKGEEERICSRPTVVMQTAVDVLFKNERNIYGKYESNLSGAVFKGVNFEKATLTGVWFANATLTGVRFHKATLMDVGFSKATLTNVWFYGATLTKVWFDNAILRDVWFDKAILTKVWFNEATLTDVGFNGAILTDVGFNGAILTDVGFNGARLTKVRFDDATLTKVWFNEATLKKVGFRDATLTDVNFAGTKLAGYSYEEIIKKSYLLTI